MPTQRSWHSARLVVALLWGALLSIAPAQAHLMAAQKGTLNIVGNAAFLVLSVPVSGLRAVDDDGDGALSKTELATHGDAIRAQVQAGVQLQGGAGALPLLLMMLDIAPVENTPAAPSSQLVVLGRFQLDSPGGNVDEPKDFESNRLSLRFSLFGKKAGEQAQDLTITRLDETQWLRFTPEQTAKVLLPSAFAVFVEYVRTGAIHVLGGADHMLFLLVVLSAAWRWRALLGALTCFTAGHALTLAACVWGGWSVSDRIVEPAIAATIVGMAAFDGWAGWRARPVQVRLRLGLVFACALIHGLGLAGVLRELTQWTPGSTQLALALAGFNVGIEMAQGGVAALAGLLVLGSKRLAGAMAQQRLSQYGPVLAMLAGTFWFVERVVATA